MRRINLFLFLFLISNTVFAVSKEYAFNQCLGGGSYTSELCVDDSALSRFKRISPYTGNALAYYPYSSIECNDPAKSFNNVTKACYLPPTCTPPAVLTLNTTTGFKTCVSPEVNCTRPKYNLDGVCTDPPDCNATWPTGGYFFDYGNKMCAEGTERVLCIGGAGSSDKYCPPIQECKPASHICTNDPDTNAAELAARTAAIAAAKAKADASKAKADEAAAQAATPQAAAAQAKALAAANAAAAKAALDNVRNNPSSTDQQLSDAVQELGNALKAQTAAAARADNTNNSAGQAAGFAASAGQHAAAVPTDPTSQHAQNDADLAGQAADGALAALNDAIAGGGSGSGEQSQDTGGATEDTLGKVLDKLTAHSQPGAYTPGTANGGNSEKGSLNDMKDQGLDEIEAGKAELSAKIDEVRNGLAALGGEVSNGGGQLPVITVGTVKGVELKYDMDQYAEQFQPVSTAILALAWVTAFSIILSK